MREDMKQLINESRHGRNGRHKCGDIRMDHDPDFAGRVSSSKFKTTSRAEPRREPLLRFLASNVGRKWDGIYAQLCSGLPTRRGQYLLKKVLEYVSINTYLAADGTPLVNCSMSGVVSALADEAFYVDPLTRTLQRSPEYNSWRVAERQYRRDSQANEVLTCFDVNRHERIKRMKGTWYRLIRDVVPEDTYVCVLDLCTNRCAEYDKSRPNATYFARREQLSRSELRRHGLVNTVAAV